MHQCFKITTNELVVTTLLNKITFYIFIEVDFVGATLPDLSMI